MVFFSLLRLLLAFNSALPARLLVSVPLKAHGILIQGLQWKVIQYLLKTIIQVTDIKHSNKEEIRRVKQINN